MDSGNTNAPLAVLTFIGGVGGSMWGVLGSLLVAIIVGVAGKFVDILVRSWLQGRDNYWRKEARKWKRLARDGNPPQRRGRPRRLLKIKRD